VVHDYLFNITGQTVILIVPRGRGGGNIQMCFRNKLSVISITGIDKEFHSMIVLGKKTAFICRSVCMKLQLIAEVNDDL